MGYTWHVCVWKVCMWSVRCMQCVVIECVHVCGSIHGMCVGFVCMYATCVVSVGNYVRCICMGKVYGMRICGMCGVRGAGRD